MISRTAFVATLPKVADGHGKAGMGSILNPPIDFLYMYMAFL